MIFNSTMQVIIKMKDKIYKNKATQVFKYRKWLVS